MAFVVACSQVVNYANISELDILSQAALMLDLGRFNLQANTEKIKHLLYQPNLYINYGWFNYEALHGI